MLQHVSICMCTYIIHIYIHMYICLHIYIHIHIYIHCNIDIHFVYTLRHVLTMLGTTRYHQAPQLSSSLSRRECEREREIPDIVVSVVEEVVVPTLASWNAWNGTGRVASKQVLSFTCYGDANGMR